jgi:L-alanine-DL-glutamate epimerase-like enolase superfamily enzyme
MIMKLQQIETFSTPLICLVRVTSADGWRGWGQTAPFNADITATVLHRQIAPHALGWDVEDLDGLVDACFERNHKFPWSYISRAVGGIETALWDLRGRQNEKPVCELLGGAPKSIPAYGSSMRRDITPLDEAERLMKLRDEKGFRAFKIRLGKECGHDADMWPGRTEMLIPTIHKALGDGVKLLADANSCYSPEKAFRIGRLLQENDFCHFEEPCPYWELEWTAEVAEKLDIDVAGGEQDVDLAQWRRMVGMHAVDIVQPDICYIGGITRALRVARFAQEAGLLCVPHSANLSLVTIFTLHLLAAIPNAGPYLEFSIEPSGWTDGLYEPALEVVDGKVKVPDGPGWGVEINPEWLEKAQYQVSGT